MKYLIIGLYLVWSFNCKIKDPCDNLVELTNDDKIENALKGSYYNYKELPIFDTQNKPVNFNEISAKYPRDSFAFTEFGDCNKIVKKLLIKKIEQSDIDLRIYLDSINSSNLELQIKRIKFLEKDTTLQKQMIEIASCNTIVISPNVDCLDIENLIDKYHEIDQNNRIALNCHIDNECLTQMVSIIEICGFEHIEKLGKAYVAKCFIIFQHANYNIRKKYFNYFETACQKHLLNRADLALMIDRNLENEIGKQRYGTQFSVTSKGNILVPLENMNKIDSLRKAIGLNSLKEYMELNNIKFKN